MSPEEKEIAELRAKLEDAEARARVAQGRVTQEVTEIQREKERQGSKAAVLAVAPTVIVNNQMDIEWAITALSPDARKKDAFNAISTSTIGKLAALSAKNTKVTEDQAVSIAKEIAESSARIMAQYLNPIPLTADAAQRQSILARREIVKESLMKPESGKDIPKELKDLVVRTGEEMHEDHASRTRKTKIKGVALAAGSLALYSAYSAVGTTGIAAIMIFGAMTGSVAVPAVLVATVIASGIGSIAAGYGSYKAASALYKTSEKSLNEYYKKAEKLSEQYKGGKAVAALSAQRSLSNEDSKSR